MDLGTSDDAFVEQRRLERAINWARWGGAALIFFLGPLFPSLGMAHVIALGVVLVGYSLLTRPLFARAATEAQQRRVAVLSQAVDTFVVAYAMLIFSPDPGWTTFIVGPLVVITGAFRFGRFGALATAAVISVAFVLIALYREAAFGIEAEMRRLGFPVAVFLLTALLMIGILRELHALRAQRERLLREASEARALREADRMQREFLAAMSHDFRNPLTVVRGALELLLGGRPGALTPRQRELADGAIRNVHRLEEFTEELLDVSQLEEGKVALEPVELDPRALLHEVVEEHRPLLDEKAQRIQLRLDGAPDRLLADRLRLRQVIANLLGNAIRYSPRGTAIEVEASGDGSSLRVSVSDHGPGVPASERARIFDAFFRGRSSNGTAGSGLGLAIARSLVVLHGGTLDYEDTPGGGATFVVSLPSQAP